MNFVCRRDNLGDALIGIVVDKQRAFDLKMIMRTSLDESTLAAAASRNSSSMLRSSRVCMFFTFGRWPNVYELKVSRDFQGRQASHRA